MIRCRLLSLFVATCLVTSGSSLAQTINEAENDTSSDTFEVITNDGVSDETIIDSSTTASIEVISNWRDSFGVLAVGYLIQGDQQRQRRKMEAFRRALERATRLRVLFRPAKTLEQLITMQINRRIQYAVHSASSYVSAQVRCKCLEPIAAPTDQQGARGVYAVIIAPYDGDVRGVNDLKGRRLAVPKPPATITRMLPLKRLKDSGFDKRGDLGTIVDVDHPIAGWQKIQAKEADAVIGWSTLQGDFQTGYSGGTLNHLFNQTSLAKSTDVRVVWQSELVPHGPHTIRSDAPTQLKKLLSEFLLSMHQKNTYAYDAVSPDLSGGFAAISDKDYYALTRLALPEVSTKDNAPKGPN